jgi:hypothetical protein
MPVAAIPRQCHVLADTVFAGSEAIPERTLLVEQGSDTLDAVIADDRLYRVEEWSPRLRTPDSLGVGTRLRDLLRHGGVYALGGEGLVYLKVPQHCGLSFQLPASAMADAPYVPDSLDEATLRRLPDSLSVAAVLVTGCGSRRAPA